MEGITRLSASLLEKLSRARATLGSKRVSRWLMVIAAASFGVVTYFALVNLPSDLGPINWVAVLVSALLVLPVAFLLGLEFREIATISGHSIGSGEAFRIAMLASASNLLPVPGAVAVKTGSLMAAGRTVKSALGANAIVAFMWVGVALMIGAPFALAGSLIVGWGSLISGAALLTGGILGIRRSSTREPLRVVGRVVAIEAALTAFAAIRIWFVMVAIGVDPSVAASVWLVVVSVLSTVVGLFPAGLGLREALSALVAPLVGLDPAVAVLVSAVDRVVRLGVLAVVGAIAAGSSRRTSVG